MPVKPASPVAAAVFLLTSAFTTAEEQPARITMGNGEANWIVTDGATRSGAVFSFPEVQIADNGWLVMHPFEDGKPNGRIYVGASYVAAGNNRDVEVTVDHTPASGDMYIVMLHSDVDQDKVFDFVFVADGVNVEDRAVFEGTTMVGHAWAAP